jgi:hypothetical protein
VQDIDDLASGLAAHIGGSLLSRHFKLLENGGRNGPRGVESLFAGLLRPAWVWGRGAAVGCYYACLSCLGGADARLDPTCRSPLAGGFRPPFMSPRSIWVLLTAMMCHDLMIRGVHEGRRVSRIRYLKTLESISCSNLFTENNKLNTP